MIAIFCKNNSAGHKKNGTNDFWVCTSMGRDHQAASFFPKRLIFADPTNPGGGTEGGAKSAEITSDNLGEKILDLQETKGLSANTISIALGVLETTDEKAKKRLLAYTQELSSGSIDTAGFNLRLKFLTGKTPEAATAPEAKPTEPEAEVEIIKLGTSAKIGDLLSHVERLVENAKEIKPEDVEKYVKLQESLKSLTERDKETGKEVKKLLSLYVKQKKLTQEQADEIYDLDFIQGDYEKEWRELTVDFPGTAVELDKLKTAKKAEAKELNELEKEFGKFMNRFREVMKEAQNEIMTKAAREKALENLSRSAGITIKEGKALMYLDKFTETRKEGLKWPRSYAFIKDVVFDPTDNSPIIFIESRDNATGKLIIDKFTPAAFLKWVDDESVTEDLRSKKDLETSIGVSVKEGDIFEYRFITGDAIKKGEDRTVKIEKIFEGKDAQGNKTTMIKLDKDVVVEPSSLVSRDIVSIGEFAKWFKRNEAVKPIATLAELQNALKIHNEEVNKQNNRDPKYFPPIQVVKNEILKYDDNSGRTFVIKDANDQGVTISDDGGDNHFTPAAFLRWVKNNEVEKKDATAEAALETSFIDDAKKRLEAQAKLENEKNKQNQARLDDAHSGHHGKKHGHGHGHSEDPSQYSSNYLRRLWNDTQFITPHNLFEMGKTIYEFVKRKLHRREHGAIGVVGENMFGGWWTEMGAEFKGVAQHAENEEVEHHAKHYRTMGYETVQHELHKAPNKDILKAAITVLCEKGQMRWDDPMFWGSLNRLANGSPCWVRDKATHLEKIEKILDSWFGNDTFREFRNKQDSGYNSVRTNFSDRAARLENDPEGNGGLRFALQRLLYNHMHGEYVHPAEYESYLQWAIKAGKLNFEDKIFFIMMGVGQPGLDSHGHHSTPLLHIDRVGALNSELLNNFPFLDFFTNPSTIQVDEDGEPIIVNGKAKTGKPGINNYKKWIREYVQQDLGGSAEDVSEPSKLVPKKNLGDFTRKIMAWDSSTRTRIEKSARDVTNWDHDDMDVHAAILTDSLIDQMVLKSGGSKQSISQMGLKNSIVGFNNFIKIKMGMLKDNAKDPTASQQDMRHLLNLMKSFTKLDALLDNRLNHGQNLSRFSRTDWNSKALADQVNLVGTHAQQVRNLIGELCKKLDDQTGGEYELAESWKILQQDPDRLTERERKKQHDMYPLFSKSLDGAFDRLQSAGKDPGALFLSLTSKLDGIQEKGQKSAAEEEKQDIGTIAFQPYEPKKGGESGEER